MFALCACSTLPAKDDLLNPPAAAMTKPKPLPLLKVDDTLPPDAPSGSGLADMVQDNLSIIRLYRELAARHDALVDYVMSRLQQQVLFFFCSTLFLVFFLFFF